MYRYKHVIPTLNEKVPGDEDFKIMARFVACCSSSSHSTFWEPYIIAVVCTDPDH